MQEPILRLHDDASEAADEQDTTPSPEEQQKAAQKELKKLKKQNRRLERELTYRTNLLQKTDELYKTSERVLTKAHQDLEKMIKRQQAMQAELHEVSRKAAIGELSARVIHEVLNPMTSLMGRLQRLTDRAKGSEEDSGTTLLREIVEDWQGMLSEQELAAYVTECESGQSEDFREDLNDATTILNVLDKDRAETLEDLAFVERTGAHMVKIINNMRTAGRTQDEATLVEPNAVIADAVELVADMVRRHGVIIRERYAPHIPNIKTDPAEVIQIVTNLITNAQQAISGPGEVEVITGFDNGRVEIRVKDSGPGIQLDPDQHELIFEGGFTTKPPGEGTGLGLAICRRFARKYQGDIVLEWTRPGEGCQFLFWLPPAVEEEQD